MVREFDYMNQYSCAPGACLRSRQNAPGFVGPESSFVECYNASNGTVVTPNVWNPVYDRNVAPPTGTSTATCSAPGTAAAAVAAGTAAATAAGLTVTHQSNSCAWLWWVIAALAAILIIGLLIYLLSKTGKHKKANDCIDSKALHKNQEGLLSDAQKHKADAIAHEQQACAAINSAAAHQQQAQLAAQQSVIDQVAAQQAAAFEQLARQHSAIAQQAAAAAASTTAPHLACPPAAPVPCAQPITSSCGTADAGKTHNVYNKTQRGGITCPNNWQAMRDGYVY